MVRRSVKIAPRARRWFLNELAGLIRVNPPAAENLVKRFELFRDNLGEFSGMGVMGDIPGTRRVVMRPYILTIRVKGGAIEIVAIRHSRQNDARTPQEARMELDES
jgi:plasmid stabilization system protein ParE